ncbi:hypothetical protein QYE76_025115 [Lolium multiflorum]|uniref:CCHC-type domain-containing protein n=1 Tax=Lolium multiflorum TaxID=4521 RepID=A0AAD8RDF0_LOLMU|nr:hypothetical protein QYE76_025115 [Lolium multiflorum]
MPSSSSTTPLPSHQPPALLPPSHRPCPGLDPTPAAPPTALAGDDGAPIPPSIECSEVFLPPPLLVFFWMEGENAVQLPPNISPMLVTGSPLGHTERVWEEVGGRRCSRRGKTLAPPARKETGSSSAFKRRTFGICFHCLAADHIVAECRGSVRCLGCRLSGHLERDCKAHHPDGHGRSPPAPPCRASDMPTDHAAIP